jgi:TPR repeat protein
VTIAETPVIIDAVAQYKLAQKYEKGIGVSKNPAKALQLYEQSAASGYAPAQFTLGVSYEMGHGVSKDLAKAIALYQQAADQGNSDAICKLGSLSYYGTGMPKNTRKAIELYQKAAAQGNAYGQMMLGHIYEYEDGDIDRAIEAYTKAVDMGSAEAKLYATKLTTFRDANKHQIKLRDCLEYDPSRLEIVDKGDFGWLLTDGRWSMQSFDNKADAEQALAMARRHTSRCYIGRDNRRSDHNAYIAQFWEGDSGIETDLSSSTGCFSYDPTQLKIVDQGSVGWVLSNERFGMQLFDNKEDAEEGLAAAKRYTHRCIIGTGNRRSNRLDYILEYWK